MSKKGNANAKVGMDLAIGVIFVLAIGLAIADDVIGDLTTANLTGQGEAASLTGISATVAGFVSLIIVAGFIFFVAKLMGMF